MNLLSAPNTNSLTSQENNFDFKCEELNAPIWQQIYNEASNVAISEPILKRRLQKLVLERRKQNKILVKEILASILAWLLSCDDMPKPELYAVLYKILEANVYILNQVTADLVAFKTGDRGSYNYLNILLNFKGFHALETYRISHSLWKNNRKELALALWSQSSRTFAVDIHPAARIGAGLMLDHATGIVIGETAEIDDNVTIYQQVTLGAKGNNCGPRHPKIRSGVTIGAGAKIIGNIEIGAMSTVGAGSVVLESVPPNCTVVGIPAKIVG